MGTRPGGVRLTSGCNGDNLPPNWWRNKDLLRQEYDAHGTFDRISAAHGGNPSSRTLNKWWHMLHLPEIRPGPRIGPYAPLAPAPMPGPPDDTWLLGALKKLGDEATVEQLADIGDVAPRVVRETLERLGRQGYRVADEEAVVVLDRKPPATNNVHKLLFDGDTFRFAVVSDTHICSREERLEELHIACDMIVEEGIDTIFHPGDLTAGLDIYAGQVRDVHKHTLDEQVHYTVDNLPARDGLTWKIIAGNHDLLGGAAKVGFDPVRAVANLRPDVEYLGEYSAWLELPNGGWVHMLHPGGGASYALSYKPQKLCEGYEAGRKPNLLLLGHYHRRGNFRHREIESILCGTFEGSTNLAKRYGMGQPAVGFHIIECTMADDGSLVRYKLEWFPFFYGRHAALAEAA